MLILRFHRYMYNNQISAIGTGAFTGLIALITLFDPIPRWHVPNLVSVSSVLPISLNPQSQELQYPT